MRLRPRSFDEVFEHYPHKGTSPGLPYTKDGIRKKGLVTYSHCRHYYNKFKHDRFHNVPCNGWYRTQVSKSPKFRAIWVYPYHVTIAEGQFAQPLIHLYKGYKTPYSIWMNYSKGDMRLLMNQRTENTTWLALDWSAFDTNVPSWLIYDSFEILKSQFELTHSEEDLWHKVVNYFVHTPIKFPSGHIRVKHNSVPSGSYFTNLLDSVINHIVCCFLTTFKRIYVMGDDALMLVEQVPDLESLRTIARYIFGFEMNVEKSESGRLVSYLGYRMSNEGYPMANYDKLVAQLLLPDRPDRDEHDFASRAKALLLSCFGVGCLEFSSIVQQYLDETQQADIEPAHYIMKKLNHMGLEDFSSVRTLIQRI